MPGSTSTGMTGPAMPHQTGHALPLGPAPRPWPCLLALDSVSWLWSQSLGSGLWILDSGL